MKPAHCILVGVNSLRLSIPGNTEGGPVCQPPRPATHAVFSFRLAKSLSINQLAAFRDWIWKLPREIGLTLDAVYETQSMTLIFQAPCAFWLKLNGYKFVQLICEAKSDNLLRNTPGLEQENIPPNPSQTAGNSGYHPGWYCSY
ncbi:hypothetical protein BDV41DRAFT_547798 [Aspergillus transmontanensis]|uniref:Uncharacterized protein n=1 Tax=Aspergillus transmontanensis TaxID=1034304 RepID=A0A5N6VMK8_9EURO|nr:hypothetical protein BDV41DRAFT_547798 [Aspergillus transmontanensis]